jgi:hypothetical protein
MIDKKIIPIWKLNLPVESMCPSTLFAVVGVGDIIWRSRLGRIGAPATWLIIMTTARIMVERDMLVRTVNISG